METNIILPLCRAQRQKQLYDEKYSKDRELIKKNRCYHRLYYQFVTRRIKHSLEPLAVPSVSEYMDDPSKWDELLKRDMRDARKENTCHVCGKKFPLGLKTKYCSKECERIARKTARIKYDSGRYVKIVKKNKTKPKKKRKTPEDKIDAEIRRKAYNKLYAQLYYQNVTKRKRHGLEPLDDLDIVKMCQQIKQKIPF